MLTLFMLPSCSTSHDGLMVVREYDHVIVEEVGQVTQWMFDLILQIWDAADQEQVLVFVSARPFDSPRCPDVRKRILTEMLRCKCEVLAKKLSLQKIVSGNCQRTQGT